MNLHMSSCFFCWNTLTCSLFWAIFTLICSSSLDRVTSLVFLFNIILNNTNKYHSEVKESTWTIIIVRHNIEIYWIVCNGTPSWITFLLRKTQASVSVYGFFCFFLDNWLHGTFTWFSLISNLDITGGRTYFKKWCSSFLCLSLSAFVWDTTASISLVVGFLDSSVKYTK